MNEKDSRSRKALAVRYSMLALLGVFIAIGAVARMWRIEEVGVGGSDNFFYLTIAASWFDPETNFPWAEEVFRPALYAAYALALQFLGVHDSSVKWLNVSTDLLTILLLFGAGLLVTRGRKLLALAPAVVWAGLPMAIMMSRQELPHTLSTFFVVAAFGSFVAHRRVGSVRGQHLWLMASGTLGGLAALTHEELILLAAGYGVFLLGADGPSSRSRRLGLLLAFAVPFTLVVLPLLRMHLGTAASLASGTEDAPTLLDEPLRPVRFAWYGLSGISHFAWPLGACLAAAWVLIRRLRRPLDPVSCDGVSLPLLIFSLHILAYSIFFPNLHARTLLPLFPLVSLAVIFAAHRFLRDLEVPSHAATTIMISVALLATPLHFENFYRWSGKFDPPQFDRDEVGLHRLWSRSYVTTWPRGTHDLLKDLVDEDSRLLVATSIMYPYPGRRALQSPVYFGDDASYLIDYEEPLREILVKRDIEWVLLSRFGADRRILERATLSRYLYDQRWTRYLPLTHLGAPLGLSREEFTLETEFLRLREILESCGARAITIPAEATPDQFPEGWLVYRLPRPLDCPPVPESEPTTGDRG